MLEERHGVAGARGSAKPQAVRLNNEGGHFGALHVQVA
jgi:hypothetical protein